MTHWKTSLVCVAGGYYAFGALLVMFACHEPAIATLAAGTFSFGVLFLGLAWLVRGDVLPGLGTLSIATWSALLALHAGTPREHSAVLAIALTICALSHAAEFGPRRRIALAAAAAGLLAIVATAARIQVGAVTMLACASHAILGVVLIFTSSTLTGIGQVRRALESRDGSTH